MIGLMFFGSIGLWILFAIYLAVKIPGWFGVSGNRQWWWFFALMPLLVFLPVIDEVIAIPQARALCKQAEEAFWYDPEAKGKILANVSCSNMNNREVLIGLNIKATFEEQGACLLDTGQPAIRWTFVRFSSGYLNFPEGSSGGSMPLVLPSECPSTLALRQKIQNTKNFLQLIRIK